MATSIRLTPEIEQRLDTLASKTGRSKAFYLREIIENGLDDNDWVIRVVTSRWLRPVLKGFGITQVVVRDGES